MLLTTCFYFSFKFSDHLFITGGSSQGLVLLCNVFFQYGDAVFVADLTGSSLDIFRDLGLKVVSGKCCFYLLSYRCTQGLSFHFSPTFQLKIQD